VVSITTRAAGNSLTMALSASIPLRSGSRRSMSVTSGRCWRNKTIASPPVAAWATMVMSAWLLMMAAIPSRNSG
jgi:hypothetical protein